MTVEFNVSANSVDEARAKAQKLADILNERDSGHRAWVKSMIKDVSDIDVGELNKDKANVANT